METLETAQPRGRVALRQERNREALVLAGYKVMSKKGIDAATMQEIAELADVGAGTVYSYFKSKDDLAVVVLERVMLNLAIRIDTVIFTFADPAQYYAFGIRTVLEAATRDRRWKQLLYRSEVIANAIYNSMGPFAIRDLENATKAGRFKITDAKLTFKLACFATIGAALDITKRVLPPSAIDETVVRLLCMNGLSQEEATELASRPCPPLPPENSVTEHKLK
ncbi:MAG: TetR/AcrR family transcriptional regulator [Alphaproteobacteria bacterium]|nr:TetR/AcrR family transcriptional regulator [Alphaproteobacteria bacterium]